MTIKFEHVDSAFKFTSNVRKFKENDPYHFKMDNIPVEQLEENVLWLKDQVEKGGVTVSEISRDIFSELKPFVIGGDRTVYVNPGRFTARINSAYDQKTLSKLVVSNSSVGIGIPDKFFEKEDLITQFYADLATTTIAGNLAYNLNGLETLVTTWAVDAEHKYKDLNNTGTDLKYNLASKILGLASVPGQQGNNKALTTLLEAENITSDMYGELSGIHSKFVLKWRAVSRTAIVDVPSELSIEVDDWDSSDFSSSTKTFSNATSRIDLLFIYSHPVDASSTTILKRSGGAQTTITKAQLGIVKGAGYVTGTTLTDNLKGSSDVRMLADVHDQDATANTGFVDADGNEIHGSFPSPDDLMNITPNLVAELESVFDDADSTDGLNLIGQSVLPVAYIVVKKAIAGTTFTGKGILTSNDILDIRPFFRTTELSYNERAGISAATPPLSFANPAVGKAQLDDSEKRMVDYHNSNMVTLLSQSAVVARGTVYGGLKYGPEGTLMMMHSGQSGYDDKSGNWEPDAILDTLNIQNSTVNGAIRYIPDLPEWDERSLVEPATHEIIKYVHQKVSGTTDVASHAPGHFWESGPAGIGSTKIAMGYNQSVPLQVLRFVTKKIEVTLPDWAVDYDVSISYENCIPQTNPGHYQSHNTHHKATHGLFQGMQVSKKSIINNVATFVILSTLGGATEGDSGWGSAYLPYEFFNTHFTSDDKIRQLLGFAVPFSDEVGDFTYTHKGAPKTNSLSQYLTNTGASIMPSVSFIVTAYGQEDVTFTGGSTV